MTPTQSSCHTRIRLLGSLPPCSPSLSLYPSFCPHVSVSVCSSVCLGPAPKIFCTSTISQAESKHWWLDGYIFIFDRLWLVLTISPLQLSWQWLKGLTRSILCLWLLVTVGPVNVFQCPPPIDWQQQCKNMLQKQPIYQSSFTFHSFLVNGKIFPGYALKLNQHRGYELIDHGINSSFFFVK